MPRRKKDPDTPKRPLSSYMFYSKERRPKLQQEQPSLAFGDYSKLIAAEWKQMTTEDREPFLELSQKDKVRYDEALKAYKEKKKNEQPQYEIGQMNKHFTTQDNINAHQMRQRSQDHNYRMQYLQRQKLMQNAGYGNFNQYFVPEMASNHFQASQYMRNGTQAQAGQPYGIFQAQAPQQHYGYYNQRMLHQENELQHQQRERQQLQALHQNGTSSHQQQHLNNQMQMINSFSPQAQSYIYSPQVSQQRQHFVQQPIGVQQQFQQQMDDRAHFNLAQQRAAQLQYVHTQDGPKLPDPVPKAVHEPVAQQKLESSVAEPSNSNVGSGLSSGIVNTSTIYETKPTAVESQLLPGEIASNKPDIQTGHTEITEAEQNNDLAEESSSETKENDTTEKIGDIIESTGDVFTDNVITEEAR